MQPETIVAIVTLLVTVNTGVATLAWWLSGRFVKLQDAIEIKLTAHETKDETRFEMINNRMWRIELRNAARDRKISDNGDGLEM